MAPTIPSPAMISGGMFGADGTVAVPPTWTGSDSGDSDRLPRSSKAVTMKV